MKKVLVVLAVAMVMLMGCGKESKSSEKDEVVFFNQCEFKISQAEEIGVTVGTQLVIPVEVVEIITDEKGEKWRVCPVQYVSSQNWNSVEIYPGWPIAYYNYEE